MTIDELLQSYDAVDLEYQAKFRNDSLNVANRQMDKKSFSFIPKKEEVERICLVNQLDRCFDNEN